MAIGSRTAGDPVFELEAAVPGPWRAQLCGAIAHPGFAALAAFVAAERRRVDVYPPPNLVFHALALTPPQAVRAVILGQDPYHRPGQAQGLAFSVPDDVKAPPSLRNILGELSQEGPLHSLEPWARRGVLLLNTVLTVERGRPRSHVGRGWEAFTDAVIHSVDSLPGPIVFLLWGRAAREKAALIDRGRHVVHEAGHPSPYSYRRHFKGRAGFADTNDALTARGCTPLDWRLVERSS